MQEQKEITWHTSLVPQIILKNMKGSIVSMNYFLNIQSTSIFTIPKMLETFIETI